MLATSSTTLDKRAFRATMGQFATGITIISTACAGDVHGMTANAFMSVSLDPPLVLVSIGHNARMHDLLTLEQPFGVSVLRADQAALSDHFAGRATTCATVSWEWTDGVPLLGGTGARIAAQVVSIVPAGDHTLFIGQVTAVDHSAGEPLIFHAGKYAALQPPCPADTILAIAASGNASVN